MKLTNKLGLPQPIFDAVANDPYSKGDADYSITGLLVPPQIAVLRKVYDAQLEEDCSSRIFSLIGQCIHGILERAEKTELAEKRYYMTIDGVKVSGQLDRFIYHEGKIQDYKVTSLWKVKSGVPLEFTQQVNCYAELLRANDLPVHLAEIVAILRDWHQSTAARSTNYPPQQILVLPVELWPSEQAKEFIRQRIAQHQAAYAGLSTNTLPECSEADRWATPDQWAVMKLGLKRAVALYAVEAEAEAHIKQGGGAYYLEFRPGENKRCDNYCQVSGICTQYQSIQAARRSLS